MKRHIAQTVTPQRDILVGFATLSLISGTTPLGARHLVSGSRAALMAKYAASPAVDEQATTYDSLALEEQLSSLTYAGKDVSIDPGEVHIQISKGHLVVTHDSYIDDWHNVPTIMEAESKRCLALSVLLYKNVLRDDNGSHSTFEDVTWIAGDGAGENYFAIIDGGGIGFTGTLPFDLFPQADGYQLSEATYVAIGRGGSHIPPLSGIMPTDIDGNPISCNASLIMPDEQWNVGNPETPADTDDSAYFYEEEIEIEAPSPEEEAPSEPVEPQEPETQPAEEPKPEQETTPSDAGGNPSDDKSGRDDKGTDDKGSDKKSDDKGGGQGGGSDDKGGGQGGGSDDKGGGQGGGGSDDQGGGQGGGSDDQGGGQGGGGSDDQGGGGTTPAVLAIVRRRFHA